MNPRARDWLIGLAVVGVITMLTIRIVFFDNASALEGRLNQLEVRMAIMNETAIGLSVARTAQIKMLQDQVLGLTELTREMAEALQVPEIKDDWRYEYERL